MSSTPRSYLPYELDGDGYVDNWLVAGPQTIDVSDLKGPAREDLTVQVAQHYYTLDSQIAETPREWDPPFFVDGETFRWRYTRCREDHLVDLSGIYCPAHYLRSWAYAEIACDETHQVSLVLTTWGPADVWLEDEHLHRHEAFHGGGAQSVTFPATLREGHNGLLVRFEQVALGACTYAMALQVTPKPDRESAAMSVMLPTIIEDVDRRKNLEEVIEAAYLDRYVYGGGDPVVVQWPPDLETSTNVGLRFRRPEGPIYKEQLVTRGEPAASFDLIKPLRVPDGAYQVVVRPWYLEYYESHQRVQKFMDLQISKNDYSGAAYGTFEERRREALMHAARLGGNIFSETAKMALEAWSHVNGDAIQGTIENLRQGDGCDLRTLVGLLALAQRYVDAPSFPGQLKEPLEACIADCAHWACDAAQDGLTLGPENDRVLAYTSQILIGQRHPERCLTEGGQTGAAVRDRGERLALAWLYERVTAGFPTWDSPDVFESYLLALSCLTDLANNEEVRDLAAICLDKVFLGLALNSYQGAFGSTHRKASTAAVKNARLEATSGATRLMWGKGVFNHHIAGLVSLCCTRQYQLPVVIKGIARHLPDELWNREHHARQTKDGQGVDKTTYKTPDYMLCSAQDYRPGEEGNQEHIWQATMSPDALVFVNHPACMSEHDARRPNFWRGNRVLPRVAQWRDVLIAVYDLPEDDWLGFTHAYFPIHAFDQHAMEDGWAFGCKEGAFVALGAAQGLDLVKRGQSAYQELRSYGPQNVWLCHMGRAALDGSFSAFKERLLSQTVRFGELGVKFTTLRGDDIAFGWESPLRVNGKECSIHGFKHYDNPYCTVDWPASDMRIDLGLQSLVLAFEEPPESW
jgi:hypothetical protein